MLGYYIGTIPVSVPTDDMACIATTRTGLQTMINVASRDANNEHYTFGESKTKIIITNSRLAPTEWTKLNAWTLNETPLEVVKDQVHLGLLRTSEPKHDSTVTDRIKCARRTRYSITGAGMHGLNGLNPVATLKIWNTYILTRLTYGLEVLNLSIRKVPVCC